MLRQHPARRAREALGGTVLAHIDLGAAVVGAHADRLQSLGACEAVLVPRLARDGVAVAGAGALQEQRARPLRVRHLEGKRHVAAERVTGNHRLLDAEFIEDRAHVLDGQFAAVARVVGWAVALTVAAHVPADQPVAVGERLDLRPPHQAGRRVTMGQQDGQRIRVLRPMVLVMDRDSVAVERGHGCHLRASAGAAGGAPAAGGQLIIARDAVPSRDDSGDDSGDGTGANGARA